MQDAILKNRKNDVVNILNFASNHGVLKDVLDKGIGGTSLDLAKQKNRTEIVKIIEEKIAQFKAKTQHRPPKDADGQAAPPQSGQGESHEKGDMPTEKDLQNLADKLYSGIKDHEDIRSILASNGIQNVLMSGGLRDKERNYYTFLIHAINCNYEEAAIKILESANPDTLKFLLKEKPEVLIKGHLVDYTALKYATKKGFANLVKAIKQKNESSLAADDHAASPQSGQGESHKKGDMVTTTNLA